MNGNSEGIIFSNHNCSANAAREQALAGALRMVTARSSRNISCMAVENLDFMRVILKMVKGL